MGTSIEWVRGEDGSEGATWNFARGCSRVDTACEHCYAQSLAHRFSGKDQPYEGLTVLGKHGPRWTGEVRFLPEALSIPLKWRKGRRIFPCSMSDAFHDDLTNEQIAAAFGVMAATPQHTYVMTTKRAKRMREWFGWVEALSRQNGVGPAVTCGIEAVKHGAEVDYLGFVGGVWPLPNVHLGVSAGTQASADERIADLLETSPMRPAAVRWVSLEPLIEAVDISRYLKPTLVTNAGERLQHRDPRASTEGGEWHYGLNWVVVGGESGPGARPCSIEWVEDIVRQCKVANTAVFVKQLGARPYGGKLDLPLSMVSRKGSDMQEWPESLRVREMPTAKGAV